jgi:hypothetical protein
MSAAALPATLLGSLRAQVKAAAWFAALGEPLTEGDRSDAIAYAEVLGLGALVVDLVRDWPQAERLLKTPDTSGWWDREEALRKALVVEAEARYPGRAQWTALTELTTEAGDLVHGKAAAAAARMGNAARPSIHVAAGAAAQAVYQLAVARLAGRENSPFERKFRVFVAGRWLLGVAGSRLVLF